LPKPVGARADARTEAQRKDPTAALPWSPPARVLVSALVLFHLAAVILAPLALVQPRSELCVELADLVRPYINAADLNHGYRFFAPDPGPSHLIHYVLEFSDGKTREGTFPNLEEERPRLLYHRYFMLSEHLDGLLTEWQQILQRSREPVEIADQQELAGFAAKSGEVFQAFAKSYADELLRRTGAKRVSLDLIEHRIASPDEVLAGKRLDDKASYSVKFKIGTFTAGGPVEELH
jgi:hypothetical protein